MKDNKNNNFNVDHLTELELRPISQVYNQIRYWSALDDAGVEKWDYTSYTRTERREKGVPTSRKTAGMDGSGTRKLIVICLVLLCTIGLSAGGYLAWPYLSRKLSIGVSNSTPIPYQTAYAVRLGNRDLGVIADKERMDKFIADWMVKNNATVEGITYKIAQAITYDEILMETRFIAPPDDVQTAFVKHATLEIDTTPVAPITPIALA